MDELAKRGDVGRPPLEPGHRLTMIRLSERILDRIDAVMGKKKQRSAFIRMAIQEKLQRDEAATKQPKKRK
jgi:metal-responsive CopG/Arc/MetJ family transcriptional regulator